MNTEQQLIEKWRELPPEKQKQVFEFVESLEKKQTKLRQTNLGQSLRQIRAKIVAAEEPLLNQAEVEQEVINLKGGLANNDK